MVDLKKAAQGKRVLPIFPTIGECITTLIPSEIRISESSMPDNSKSFGVLTAPALSIKSFFELNFNSAFNALNTNSSLIFKQDF